MERSAIQEPDRERRQSPLPPSLSLSRVSVPHPQIPLCFLWATALGEAGSHGVTRDAGYRAKSRRGRP